jgi:hypothetical protein
MGLNSVMSLRELRELDNGSTFFRVFVVKEITSCKFEPFAAYLGKNRLRFDSVLFEQSSSTVSRKQTECILGEADVGVAMGNFLADLT